MADIAKHFDHIKQTIGDLENAAGRKQGSVKLIAASKTQPDDAIMQALNAGHRIFGENYVQEAERRWLPLRASYPDLRLHLIGPLQSNKAGQAVRLFDCIQTLDRPKLADALFAEMIKQNRFPLCFIQVNTGDESQKAGVFPHALPALLDHCSSLDLRIAGLMCIPPHTDPPVFHFALLQKLALRHGLRELSMGMSADFKKAVPLGATYVRIGTALFGDRPAAA